VRVVYTCVLSPWDPRHGGGQWCVHELACALARRGHDVEVVYSGSKDIPFSDLPYRAHVLSHRERLYLNPLEFANFLKGYERREAILHSSGYEAAFLRRVTRKRLPLVMTCRHPDPASLVDGPGVFHGIRRVRWFRRKIIPLLERRALRSADLVASPSAFCATALRQRGYLDGEARIEVVHDGAPALPEAPTAERGVELVCVARLDEHKGIDVLLGAMAMLEEPRPRLDLLGTGLQEQELRRMVDQLNLKTTVRFRGHQDRERLAAILSGAMALVLPSRSDNFPLAILEAMQAGLPIVATRAGGIPEAVRDGEEALLVPPGDPAALADALRIIQGDSGLRGRLGAAGRERGKAFSWDRTAETYEGLYLALQR
jgi:glycosyltransferase involved in cell wall biosynthesis